MKNIIFLMITLLNITLSFASDFDETNIINEININKPTILENNDDFKEFTEQDLKENSFENTSIMPRMFFDENNNPILTLEELLQYDIVYDEFQNPIFVREIDENTLRELTFENENFIQTIDTTNTNDEVQNVEPINSTNNENNESEVLNNTFNSIDSNFTLYIMMASIGAGAFFFNGKNL